MDITVIICTYNRCQSLAKTLESLAASTLPVSTDWEVLIVDNNSADQTRAIVENFSRCFQNRFRYIYEARQGLSFARNAGIASARGNILAFTDDDVTVDPDWLQNITSCFFRGEYAAAGGRILAANEFCCPEWLALEGSYNVGGMLALFDLGDHAHTIDTPAFGASMAFRREMFERYGLFRTDLGRCGSNLMSNEDTEFGRRLLSAGERIWYEASAVVYHPVPDSRLKKSYFLSFWFNLGKATIREMEPRPDIWRIPRHYFTAFKMLFFLCPLRALKWMIAFDKKERFFCRGRVWEAAGQITEMYRMWFTDEARRTSTEIG